MDDIKAKQQVVEKIKEVGKILVTVSKDPSVDALSAAIGLTMLLDKQEKYATALFSGQTPPAIAFLEPEKTFDDTTDSLRDFIIALNKEKADHLRYKVEGDSVKIFITPYKTTITEDDLVFSQGDYNVELVIALGVGDQNDLDASLENHGQILHDATIITMTAGDDTSTLGGIDWHDSNSSSLSEMIAGLAEAMKDDKKNPLLDGPIATALLTGIVAETDRFSNERTTSKVMTVAASLMALGADQQLIATELQKSHEITAPSAQDSANTPDKEDTDEQGSLSIKKDGLSISHESETLEELDKRVRGQQPAEPADATQAVDSPAVETEGDASATSAPAPEATAPELANTNAAPNSAYALTDEPAAEPTLGGSLSATTEQAADDARRDAESDQNKTILTHSYLSGEPAAASAATASAPQSAYALPAEEHPEAAAVTAPAEPAPVVMPVGGERVIQPLASAYASPEPIITPESLAAPAPEPASPAPAAAPQPTPADLGLPLPPPLPDFSQGIAPPTALPLPPASQPPALLGDILAPEQPPQPTPADLAQPAGIQQLTIPQPEPQIPQPVTTPVPSMAAAAPADPGQFQIPGQQSQF